MCVCVCGLTFYKKNVEAKLKAKAEEEEAVHFLLADQLLFLFLSSFHRLALGPNQLTTLVFSSFFWKNQSVA